MKLIDFIKIGSTVEAEGILTGEFSNHVFNKAVNCEPTEAQKEAGNYKMGHITVNGLYITIENPKGSKRSGTDGSGKTWTVTMKHHYGYIKGTKGKDGDHIDVFVGSDTASDKVFVVDQASKNGTFDEHKVMIGFKNLDKAKEAYLSNYEKGWNGLKTITEVSLENFNRWVNNKSKKVKPFSEYVSLNKQNEKGDMNNLSKGINIGSVEQAEELLKGGFDDSDFLEKARNVGEMHPNGKWAWSEYKPGKFDWRAAKKGDKAAAGLNNKTKSPKEAKMKSLAEEYCEEYDLKLEEMTPAGFLAKTTLVRKNADGKARKVYSYAGFLVDVASGDVSQATPSERTLGALKRKVKDADAKVKAKIVANKGDGNSSSASDSLKAKEAEYKKLQEAYNEISKKMGSLRFEIQELKKSI